MEKKNRKKQRERERKKEGGETKVTGTPCAPLLRLQSDRVPPSRDHIFFFFFFFCVSTRAASRNSRLLFGWGKSFFRAKKS